MGLNDFQLWALSICSQTYTCTIASESEEKPKSFRDRQKKAKEKLRNEQFNNKAFRLMQAKRFFQKHG